MQIWVIKKSRCGNLSEVLSGLMSVPYYTNSSSTMLFLMNTIIVYPANLRSNKIRWAATLVDPHYTVKQVRKSESRHETREVPEHGRGRII